MRCPECGRMFDPGDLTTFDFPGRNDCFKQKAWAVIVGIFAPVIAFLCLYTIQWGAMAWWQSTSTLCWMDGVRDGSWWLLNVAGEILWPVQMVVLGLWSLCFGLLLAVRIWR